MKENEREIRRMIEEGENGQQYGKITDKRTLRETPRYQITLNGVYKS